MDNHQSSRQIRRISIRTARTPHLPTAPSQLIPNPIPQRQYSTMPSLQSNNTAHRHNHPRDLSHTQPDTCQCKKAPSQPTRTPYPHPYSTELSVPLRNIHRRQSYYLARSDIHLCSRLCCPRRMALCHSRSSGGLCCRDRYWW